MNFVQRFSIFLCLGISFVSCTKLNDDACCPDGSTIYQVGNGKIYVPNIVTDNGDGINDVFFPLGVNIASIEDFNVAVGGRVLYEIEEMYPNEPGKSWSPVQDNGYVGSFVYAFVATSTDGTRKTIMGRSCSFVYRRDAPPNLDCSQCSFATQHDGQGGFCETCPSFEYMCE